MTRTPPTPAAPSARALVRSIAIGIALWLLFALSLTACGGGDDELDATPCPNAAPRAADRQHIPQPPCRQHAA